MRNKLLLLLLTLALVVVAAFLDYRHRLSTPKLVEIGDVTTLELAIHGKPAVVKKGQAGAWRLESFEGAAPADTRANSGLVNHLLDLVRVLHDETQSAPLDPKDADAYGMRDPELKLTLRWQAPTPGDETVLFGHRDLSGRRVFAYFPKRPLLIEAPTAAVTLLENKEALDVRDRRITTFDPDDVEDLTASGKCGHFDLHRDGDRWVRGKTKPLASERVETWLTALLGTRHDGVERAGSEVDQPGENPVCHLALAGRRNRAESIDVFKAKGTLWARNSALPGIYHLPQGFLSSLIPPN